MSEFESLRELIVEKNLLDLQIALTLGVNPNCCDERGWTLLHWAAQEGNAEIIRCLLDAGANIEAKDAGGFTPLAVAIGEAVEGLTEKTAELLKRGASPNTRIGFNGTGSVLHTAAAYGWFAIIKLLIETKGIELNLRGAEGRTPLAFAREEGSKDVIDYLVRHGAKD